MSNICYTGYVSRSFLNTHLAKAKTCCYISVEFRFVFNYYLLFKSKCVFSGCQTGWTQIGSKCYRMYKQSINFASAFITCRDIGARLATLQDWFSQMEVASKSLNFCLWYFNFHKKFMVFKF